MFLSKRDEPTIDVAQTTATTSRTYTLPKIYTPLTSHTTITKDPASFGISTIFKPQPTTPTTTTNRGDVYIPPSFAPLSTTRSYVPLLPTETTTTIEPAHSGKLSGGKLAGIIMGSILGGILLVYTLYVLCWNRRRQGNTNSDSSRRAKKDTLLILQESPSSTTISDDHDFEDDKESCYTDTDDDPVGHLPRTQPHYDPHRVYSTTSIPHDPKEDFKSYYHRNTSSQKQQCPYYGGFDPMFGPHVQPPPTIIHGLGSLTEESMRGITSTSPWITSDSYFTPK